MKKGNKLLRRLYELYGKCVRAGWGVLVAPIIRKSFAACGSKVRVSMGSKFAGIGNIVVGDRVVLGEDLRVMSTRAQLIIGNHVMFGPNVTIITGNHRTDILGKYMDQIDDNHKLPENDQDVVIEDDVWIGANATILKGVRIGTGSIVASGALVTESFPPYSIIGGVPAKLLKARFTQEEIEKHKEMLAGKADL